MSKYLTKGVDRYCQRGKPYKGNYLSAKNPSKNKEIQYRSSQEILVDIQQTHQQIKQSIVKMQGII